MTAHTEPARRFFRLRTPTDRGATPVTIRVTEATELYLAVGSGRRRMYLTPAEAWAVWRCLSEAVATLGEPPDWIRVQVTSSPR